MDIRKILARWLLKPEVERLRVLTREAVNDWRMLPYLSARDPQALIDQLAEVDTRLVDMLVRQIRDYEVIGSGEASEQFRLQVVRESRALYLQDPLTQFAVELWTDYAFGSSPNLTAEDPAAQQAWDEFWKADRNAALFGERKLHKLSEDELTDGELFFVFFASKMDGAATCRTIPTEQIKEIVRDPDDARTVLYYRRDWSSDGSLNSVYYPDWSASEEQLARARLPDDAKRADALKPDTDVVVLQAAFREVSGRGWPLATASIDWSRAYKNFLQDRAAVAKAAAAIVEKYKVKGGQRAIDAMRRALGSSLAGGTGDAFETNPPPVAGSGWLENEAVDRQWMSRPTNSADAEKDGAALKKQAALGYKLYPHFLGDGDYYRLATATAMEGPTLKSFNRYQQFWGSIWRDMFKIVTGFAEHYGGKSFGSRDATVSSDRIIDLSSEEAGQVMQAVTDLLDRGLIDDVAAGALGMAILRASLDSMGIQGGDELVDQITQAEEGGTGQHPFVEDGESRFDKDVRGEVHAFWAGKIGREEFVELFERTLESGLWRAWEDGMKDVGLTAEDMTDEEETALRAMILEQFGYVAGFADFIESGSRANGGKLGALQFRVSIWTNLYSKARNMAKQMASNDPPLTWQFGDTVEHCVDCSYANGRTYRASVWARWGWVPQSRDLECQGYQCQCFFSPGDEFTRLNKGHPRRPVGP